MDRDVVIIEALVSDYRIIKEPDISWLSQYKKSMHQGDIYVEGIDYPLANDETNADFEAYRFADPYLSGNFQDVET